MTEPHRVLIVEDDRPTADDLADILRSLDCEPVIVDNKRDALAALRRESFCFAVLDLQIKMERGSIKGHDEFGRSLVREVRALYPDHAGRGYRLPILVVSGFAREVNSAVEVMKDGADDVIQKPFDGREVSASVRQALERSGRASHRSCLAQPGRASGPPGSLVLSIPADREGRRTRVAFGAASVDLTDASLRVLLFLVAGKLAGQKVHKTELGARADQGFRGISVLREALKPALGAGVDIIENDQHGHYWLVDDLAIGECDYERLAALGDSQITELAERIRQHGEQEPGRKRPGPPEA